jgi:hypothetical protein
MARVKFEDGTVINFDGQPTPDDIEEAYNSVKGIKTPAPLVNGTSGGTPGKAGEGLDYLFPAAITDRKYGNDEMGVEKMNVYGDVFNRPGAAIRSAITDPRGPGPGFLKGAKNPSETPTFGDQFQDLYFKKTPAAKTSGQFLRQVLRGTGEGVAGTLTDIATSPGDVLASLLPFTRAGKAATGLIGETSKQVIGKGGELVKEAVNSPLGKVAGKGLSNLEAGAKTLRPNTNFLRSGLPKEEAVRIGKEYGNSNATLVDVIKKKLGEKLAEADKTYQTAMNSAPQGKQINIRPAIEQAGKKLKNLGLITDTGNLTELGTSEISRDSVYGKLLDFYQSSNAISGVEKLQGRPLTQGQMIKAMKADRETLVNKEQYTFFRDKLNSLYKNKPSDVDVGDVVNQFYADGEKSGIKGLQQARKLSREAFKKKEMFLNSNTGDLKIANEQKLSRIGTKKTLSKQELDHIRELEAYVGHPITKDATNINKINAALERIKKIKKYGGTFAAGAIAGSLGKGMINRFAD